MTSFSSQSVVSAQAITGPRRGRRISSRTLQHDELRAGPLQVVPQDYPIATTGIYAVMPQRRLVPPQLRAFTDFLAGRPGEHPPREQGSAL